VKTYVKWAKVIQMVSKYDNKTLMPLLMVAFKFLNFNSSGPIKPTPIVHNDDSIFGAMTSNKSTLQGLLKNELSLFVWKPKDSILPLTLWKLHETRNLNILCVV
jgi:hypothetical protein